MVFPALRALPPLMAGLVGLHLLATAMPPYSTLLVPGTRATAPFVLQVQVAEQVSKVEVRLDLRTSTPGREGGEEALLLHRMEGVEAAQRGPAVPIRQEAESGICRVRTGEMGRPTECSRVARAAVAEAAAPQAAKAAAAAPE